MPASEVMSLYRQHKLHSGPGGPVVKKKKQAVAIQISMARKEGHKIPVKGSFQQGGQVPETGNYQVHQGERVYEDTLPPGGHVRDRPRMLGDPPSPARYTLVGDVWHPELKHRGDVNWTAERDVKGSFQHGGLVPETGNYLAHGGEQVVRAAQARDIAARTNQAQHDEWNRAMHQKENWGGAMERGRPGDLLGTPPQPRDIPPAGNDPHYAVEGLKGNIAERMREQGERAAGIRGSFDQGGEVKQTGDYQAHQGEELVPPERATAPPASVDVQTPAKRSISFGGGGGGNPMLSMMQSNVAAPLHRVEGFKTGGTIPRTGVYRLHAGEHVIPANLAKRYREMKEHG